MKAGLVAMVTAAALTLGCGSKPVQGTLRDKLLASNQEITGKVVDIKIGSLPIVVSLGGANFNYEIFTVQLPDGTRKKILAVQPTEFNIGDVMNEKYLPVQRVTLDEIHGYLAEVGYATRPTDLQYHRYLNVDGILRR